MGVMGDAVAAATALVVGELGGALPIWKGGNKERSEEREQNTHGSCVENGVLGTLCSAAVHGV